MKSVLANRDLRVFLLADALSLVGSGALWLALGIWAKSLTGSSAAAGMVIFAVLAPPVLLAPAAGMLVDRVRRRPLLVAVNLVTVPNVTGQNFGIASRMLAGAPQPSDYPDPVG